MLSYTLTGLEVGFQMPNYTVLENTPGYATVVVETRSGPGVTGQIETDVEVRVSTADFNPPEAVGEYVAGIALVGSVSHIVFLCSIC